MKTIALEEHLVTPVLGDLPLSVSDKIKLTHGNAERLLNLWPDGA